MDPKTSIKVDLLVRAARRVAYAYHNRATDGCQLFERPAEVPGAELIAVVALMQKAPEGRPWITFELMPGTSEEMGEKVKELFKTALLQDGTVELDGTVN